MSKPTSTRVLLRHTLALLCKRVFVVFVTLAIATPVLTAVYSITRAGESADTRAYAANPVTLNFQARLLNSSGAIVADGTYNVDFKVYDHLTNGGQAQGTCSGNCLWEETRTGANKVTVKAGYLSVYLGDVTSLPANIWNQQLYLTMNIGGTGAASWDGEMTPRIRLTSVPFAFRATTADAAETLSKNTGTNTGTVEFANMTADRKFLFPDTSLATTASPGTICVFNGTASNCPAASGSAYYIQNDTVLQTSANFNMQARDNGVNGTVGGVFRGAAAGQTVDLLQFQASNGTVLGAITAGGNLKVASSVDVQAAGTLNIGTSTATAVVISKSGVTTTVSGALTVTEAFTANGGATINGNTTIATTAGNTLGLGNSTGALTVTGNSSSTFVINGVTIDATEFGRLDGKDAALVDTNDAVSTAITGTGALNAGSITSGFGAIDTGADNITTTGTVTGGQLTSTVATGTAPLVVTSTTLVTNFNADYLNGQHGSFYQDASNLNAGTVASARISGSYTGITGVGTITAGTWQGGSIADAYLQDNITISSSGTVDWTALSNYPSACAAGSAISQVGDTLTCTAFATGTTASYIQNQNGGQQATSNYWISGTGRADTALITPAVRATADSTTAILFQNAAGSNNVMTIDTTNSRVGIGTTPSYKLHVSDTTTANSGTSNMGSYFTLNVSPSSAPAAITTYYGSQTLNTSSSANLNANVTLYGNVSTAQNTGGATLGAAVGAGAVAQNAGAGVVTNAIAGRFKASNTGAGSITNGVALQASTPEVTAGSIGTAYGVFIENQSVAGVGTGVGLWQAGASDINVFAGKVGIGVVPTNALDVLGTGTFSTSVLSPKVDTATAVPLTIGTTSATNITVGHNAGTFAVDGTNFDLSTAGLVTLAGGQAVDLTTQANQNLTVVADGTGTIVLNDTVTAAGTVTISGVATDITTGTNEDLTVVANGTGVINLNDSITAGGNITFAEGANRTLSVAANTTANAAGYNMTLTAGAANGSTTGNTGGALALQGGAAAGSGNNNGGDVTLQGGAGTGTAAQGLVKISATAFTAGTQQDFGSNGSITNVDNYSMIPVRATAAGLTITLPAPAASQQSVVGRILYITAIGTGGNAFTIAPAGGTSFVMNVNSTATFVWNGTIWTNAGVDGGSSSYIQNQSSTDQAASFRISGTAIAPIFKSKDSQGSGNSDNVTFQSGNANTGSNNTSGTVTLKSGDATGGNASSGNITIDAGAKTGSGTTGSISIGTTNAAAIALGYVGATTTNQGNFTVGASAGSGTVFTNNGASLYGTKAVANDSDGGSLGGTPGTPLTAAQSVDIYTSFTVNQTTANQTITLPSPTNTAAGRVIYIANIGSASFGLLGSTLNNGSTASLLWNGTAWTFAGADGTSINNQIGAAQNGDFWIQAGGSSTGIARVDGKVLTPTLDTATGVALNIGTSGGPTTTQINLNQNTVVAAGKTLTVTSALTSLTGATTGDALNVSNSTSTGNIAVFKDNATAVLTIADGGGITGTGTYTFSGPATDITTGTNEDLTVDANGTGKFVVNDSTTIGASAGSGTVFTNNGASLYGTKAVANDSDGGSLGGTPGTPLTAAQSVDIYTSFTVNQTTANQTITIPSPTNTAAGRIIYIANIGSASFGLLGSTLNNGSTASLLWNGTAWTFAGADGTSINNQIAAAQNGDFWIQSGGSSTGIGRADGKLLTPTLDTATAVALNIGTSGAVVTTQINLNQNTVVAAGKTLTVTSALTSLTGATTGDALNVSNSTSTGNIAVFKDNATAVLTIADGGGITGTGSYTFSGVATDITTSANEDLTVVANGTGVINLNDSITAGGDITFAEGANRTISNQTRTTNAAGNNLTVTAGAAGAGGSAFTGGTLSLQGGAAGGTGNANGGSVTISGGAGVGTGTQGMVNLSTTAFSSAGVQTFGTTGLQTLTAGLVDQYSNIPVLATATGVIISVPDPAQTSVIGRLLYIAARDASQDFTLRLNPGSVAPIDIVLKKNSTATLIWNGDEWTAAGASSSTDLQSAYNNTLTSAGGAEILLNPVGGNADGFTIRNNGTTPIVGGLLEVQTSIGSNLLSVNNNATEYAVNGGAESATLTGWSAAPAGGSASKYTTAGDNIATGQASVFSDNTSTAATGIKNTLSGSLTQNLKYKVSFSVRNAASTPTFTTLQAIYSSDGSASTATCVSGSTSSYTSYYNVWTRVDCTFTATSVGASNAIIIRHSDGVEHDFYIDNLSVTISADVNHAADGDADSAANIGGGTNNWGVVSSSTVTQVTSPVYNTNGAVSVTTAATAGRGVYNKLSNNIAPSTTPTLYRVAFYARGDGTNTATLDVKYTPDNGTTNISCEDFNTQVVSASTFTLVSCYFKTTAASVTNAQIRITQTSGSATVFYVDGLAVNLNTNTSSNVQVGGASKGGPTTLLTLDRSSTAPIAANNDAYLGSMYYDTTTGRIQCYEADGWGACGSSPDVFVTLTPEYTGAVLNGNGIGVMTADFCGNGAGLSVNTSLCTVSGTSRQYYTWTSPQATEQVYSIYVSYKLPSTFKSFASDDTINLTARTSNTTTGHVTYEVFKSTGSALTACGSATDVTNTTDGANFWSTKPISGNESTSCSFAPSDNVVFKINMKAYSNANVYVENLTFTYNNN